MGSQKRKPKRFYQAEAFIIKNIDSMVELTKNMLFLISQPAKTPELFHSLQETRLTMNQLADSLRRICISSLEDHIDDFAIRTRRTKKSMNKRPFGR